MKQTTRIAIAGLLSAAGSVLTALAGEFGGEEAKPAETEAPKAEKPAKAAKAAKEKAPEPKEETPAAPATPETPAEPEDEPTGKTYEELRALIKPLVEGGQGAEVKKLIAKYDPSDPPALKTMPARNHAAFEKDLAALGY